MRYIICSSCGYITKNYSKGECNRCYRRKEYLRNRITYLNRFKRHYKDNKEYYKNKKNKRRVLKYNSEYIYINIYNIYKRDRFKCGICGLRVNTKLKHPHPYSPSLDHIIPLSKGGSHTPDNVQLAHLRCNISKGSKTGFTKLLTQDGKAGKMGVIKQNEGEISE